jgi:hypothetical protein
MTGAEMTGHPSTVTGENLAVPFPTSIEVLRERGPEFLTPAFHATGALAPDNEVVEVTRLEEFVGGGAGRKAWLSVAYARDEPGLHTELFVKYPRDFGDPLRPLFAHLMRPEARFALLSRRSGFPVPVPACYFADYDPATATGLLITERIRFGEDGVEPFRDKCLDYALPGPGAHYRALISAIARLAAGHKTGLLGGHVEEHFPFELGQVRSDDLIPYSPDELTGKIDILRRFAAKHPHLLPGHIADPEFLDRFALEAPPFLAREREIKRYLNSRPEFIALCHWNANVDNAWFRRSPDAGAGAGLDAGPEAAGLEAGLLDWGSVGQMNVAQGIFGVLCATETGIWDAHAHELIDLFAAEYAAHGGPVLDVDELRLHVRLFVAMLGLAWMLDAPTLVAAQIPDLSPDADRFDEALHSDFLARAQLQLMTVFLHVWQVEDLAGALHRLPVQT